MWDYILNNLPLIVVLTIATIICGADLIKAIRVWREERQKKVAEQIECVNEKKELADTLAELKKELANINTKLAAQEDRFNKIEGALADLTISDMHDIKSWIVDQYHTFYNEQGWIDAFNAETIERRYEDYKKEGGNSYIDTLMQRLHELPMDPPIKD